MGVFKINIEVLCAATPVVLAHSPSQMPLSCPVAPPSQCELHKDGGGGGVGVARRARAARAPKAKSFATSCATSCGTSSATSSAASCAASFTCSSFTCHPRAGVGANATIKKPLMKKAVGQLGAGHGCEYLEKKVVVAAAAAAAVVVRASAGDGTRVLGVGSKAALAADRTSSRVGLASGSPRAAAFLFCPLKGCVCRVLYVPSLHVSTASATGPAAPTEGFERSKSAWRDDKETVRVGLTGYARDKPCASWGSLSCSQCSD